MFEVPHLQNLWDASVGEELPCNGNEKDPYAVAVMRRSTIVGHVPRKISAACSQFLADQRQRYYSIVGACTCTRASLRDYETLLTCTTLTPSQPTDPYGMQCKCPFSLAELAG